MEWLKEHWLMLVLIGLLLIFILVLIILVTKQKRKDKEDEKKQAELEKKKNQKRILKPVLKSKDAEKLGANSENKVISKPAKPKNPEIVKAEDKQSQNLEGKKVQKPKQPKIEPKESEGENQMKKEEKVEAKKVPAKKAEPKKAESKKVEPKKAEVKKVEAKPENETYRVVYDKEQKNWIVRIDGGQRASKRCATKEEALKVAKDLAKKKDADLSVHKKNGKFQKI